jgi:hypothetical protein
LSADLSLLRPLLPWRSLSELLPEPDLEPPASLSELEPLLPPLPFFFLCFFLPLGGPPRSLPNMPGRVLRTRSATPPGSPSENRYPFYQL